MDSRSTSSRGLIPSRAAVLIIFASAQTAAALAAQTAVNSTAAQAPAGSISAALNDSTPVKSKRHVVLHPETGHHHLPHHHTEWEMEIELVVMLVFVHVLALCFYLWLLVRDKDKQRRGRAGAKSHLKPLAQGGYMSEISGGSATPSSPSKGRQDRKGSAGTGSGGPGSASSWRTPKEILAAWGKQRERERLGKV